MRVRGKRESVDEFCRVIDDYNFERHFYRVFSVYIYDEWENDDGTITLCINGDCAWSVYSCMMIDDIGTYAKGDRENDTSLQLESRRLRLEIEVFSEEPGMCFQEHYIYKNGEEIANECVDFYEWYFDPDEYPGNNIEEKFNAFLAEIQADSVGVDVSKISMADLDGGECLRYGGFESYCDFSVM